MHEVHGQSCHSSLWCRHCRRPYLVAGGNKVRDAQGVPVEGTEAWVQDMPELREALRQQLLLNRR